MLQPPLEEDVVLTHGNGPQVGNELLRQERAAAEVPPLPLYLAVAQTQAEIGALLAGELAAVGRTPRASPPTSSSRRTRKGVSETVGVAGGVQPATHHP